MVGLESSVVMTEKFNRLNKEIVIVFHVHSADCLRLCQWEQVSNSSSSSSRGSVQCSAITAVHHNGVLATLVSHRGISTSNCALTSS